MKRISFYVAVLLCWILETRYLIEYLSITDSRIYCHTLFFLRTVRMAGIFSSPVALLEQIATRANLHQYCSMLTNVFNNVVRSVLYFSVAVCVNNTLWANTLRLKPRGWQLCEESRKLSELKIKLQFWRALQWLETQKMSTSRKGLEDFFYYPPLTVGATDICDSKLMTL